MAKTPYYLCTLFILCSLNVLAQRHRQIKRLINSSKILHDHFTGFALYDCDKDKMIYTLNADKHFTPASNTKLFTYFTAKKMLGDSIPGIRYIIKGDSLIFWGTGDPTLYRPDFNSDKVHYFLKNAPQQLFWASTNYKGDFYGWGWPYGDYDADYQTEINALPIAGNLVTFNTDSLTGKLHCFPSYFSTFVTIDYRDTTNKFTVKRPLMTNTFTVPNLTPPAQFTQQIPYKTSTDLTKALLEDTLKKPIQLIDLPMPINAQTIYSEATDTVFRAMLWPSDNFIAEQLLLVCSSTIGANLSTATAIRYSKENLLNEAPQLLHWVDGSGLSRMDLFTPESMVYLLRKIKEEIGDDNKLHHLLPEGGKKGTLKNTYTLDQNEPFVWAKTGTLTGVHNQSGYLTTRKGKQLIYSFMNNNFVEPTAEIRKEMVRIMTTIRMDY
ncbi:D-alanyl-D-alanine carboxypeptidase/D-alanyl-D-alanine-endopeptidase [Olivibacter ginsenosidimutans]|uniref:D-alanyl-D-alanine carboxypeptidase/D-alanyl-D-alanine-endopeptidase n=1 Tax=Olivibacter ginsenosidimutans TaxID=1176537 RepID=A0ABP9BTM8_9SPHI